MTFASTSILPGASREGRNSHPPRRHPPKRISSSAGGSPRKWAGSTLANQSPSRSLPRWPSRRSRAPIGASSMRAGQFCRAGEWSLVKVAKPQQDMRCDVPTIGITTIENCTKPGARVLAIRPKTILLGDPEVLAALRIATA